MGLICRLFGHNFNEVLFGVNKKNSLEQHTVENCQRCGIIRERFYNAYSGSGCLENYYPKEIKKHKKYNY